MVMAKKRIEVEELIATFTSHLRDRYPSVEDFQGGLRELLEGKREKYRGDAYIEAVERNIVYFNDLVTGVEALMDRIFKSPRNLGKVLKDVDETLSELEKSVQSRTEERYREVFLGTDDPSIAALLAIKESDREKYVERIEFEYSYLFTLKLFLSEFISMLAAIKDHHSLPADIFKSRDVVFQSIEFLTHYYLGNVKLKE